METPIRNMGKLMENESEKLKYQTPHRIHGAPSRGLNGIESIQWRWKKFPQWSVMVQNPFNGI